jgi:hypothetical protein
MVWNETTLIHDFLRKDELQYEIFVRKWHPLQLRKFVDSQNILHDIMGELVDLQNLQSLDFEGELRTIHSKFSEFKEIVGDCRAVFIFTPISTRE